MRIPRQIANWKTGIRQPRAHTLSYPRHPKPDLRCTPTARRLPREELKPAEGASADPLGLLSTGMTGPPIGAQALHHLTIKIRP